MGGRKGVQKPKNPLAVALAMMRAQKLTAKRRSEIARLAAAARWGVAEDARPYQAAAGTRHAIAKKAVRAKIERARKRPKT